MAAGPQGQKRGRGPQGKGKSGKAPFKGTNVGKNGQAVSGKKGKLSRGQARKARANNASGNGQVPAKGSNNQQGHPKFRKNGLAAPQGMHKQRRSAPSSTLLSLRITNLPNIELKDLQEFRQFVLEHVGVPLKDLFIRIRSDQTVAAFCVFEKVSDCLNSLSKLHGKVYRDHHLLVGKCVSNFAVSENCIKVSNLTSEVTEEKLWNMFESCEEIEMIYLKKTVGASLEAIIKFNESDSVTKALKLNGANLDNTKIEVVLVNPLFCVKFSLPKEVKIPSKDLESILKDLNVAHMVRTEKGKDAEVFFADEESYEKALNLTANVLHGYTVTKGKYGKKINVEKKDLQNKKLSQNKEDTNEEDAQDEEDAMEEEDSDGQEDAQEEEDSEGEEDSQEEEEEEEGGDDEDNEESDENMDVGFGVKASPKQLPSPSNRKRLSNAQKTPDDKYKLRRRN